MITHTITQMPTLEEQIEEAGHIVNKAPKGSREWIMACDALRILKRTYFIEVGKVYEPTLFKLEDIERPHQQVYSEGAGL